MRTRFVAPAVLATLLATTAALAPTSSVAAPTAPAGSTPDSTADSTGYILFTFSPLWKSKGAAKGFLGPGDLRVIAPDGSGNWALTSGPANDFDGVFAPGSQQVAFSSDRANPKAGITDLYVIDIEGTGLKRLTFGADTGKMSWSADGKQIVVRDKKGLLLVSPLTGKSTRLMRTPAGRVDSKPVWIPDMSGIVFTRSVVKNGKTLSSALWQVAPDGSEPHQLVGGSGNLKHSSDAAVSPDGTTVVWVVRHANGSSIMMGDLYFGLLDNVRTFATTKHEWFEGPSFSPDGSGIAISSGRDNAKDGSELLVYTVATREVDRLYTVVQGDISAPNWTE
jgi:Tol biopolymer transport system component